MGEIIKYQNKLLKLQEKRILELEVQISCLITYKKSLRIQNKIRNTKKKISLLKN